MHATCGSVFGEDMLRRGRATNRSLPTDTCFLTSNKILIKSQFVLKIFQSLPLRL